MDYFDAHVPIFLALPNDRILALVQRVRQNPQLDSNGHFYGWCEVIAQYAHRGQEKRHQRSNIRLAQLADHLAISALIAITAGGGQGGVGKIA